VILLIPKKRVLNPSEMLPYLVPTTAAKFYQDVIKVTSRFCELLQNAVLRHSRAFVSSYSTSDKFLLLKVEHGTHRKHVACYHSTGIEVHPILRNQFRIVSSVVLIRAMSHNGQVPLDPTFRDDVGSVQLQKVIGVVR
jgi:hypothetical protein